MGAQKAVVIMCRYSCPLQRKDSNVDQEREVRKRLDQKGIDHTNAIVLMDEAVSGMKMDRESILQLQEWIRQGLVSVLAVSAKI